jgi:arylsulfatase
MPSIAVVVLDTLRYDTFYDRFDWLPGRHFTRAYAPSHWTVPVHGSLFTGLYASEIGVHGHSPSLDCPEQVLAEQFREAGYRTRCFTANPQMDYYEGWDRGFEDFVTYSSLDAYRDDDFDWGRAFDDIAATGVEKYARAIGRCLADDSATLRSLGKGFALYRRSEADGGARSVRDRIRGTDFADEEFLFVNLMEAHTPYHPPDDGDPIIVVAADAFSEESLDLARIRAAYRRSAAYLSEQYREIFADLTDTFDYVVTLADHGELLGEHGLVNHSFGLWPELVHVPLVVSGDDVDTGYDDRVTSLLDVHRTVADLAGVDVESRGANLFENPASKPALFEYHGLLPFHEAQFDRKDVPTATFEKRTEPLTGFVAPDGAFAQETHTRGLRTIGHFDVDPSERLAELTADIDRRDVDEEPRRVPEGVRDRLENLGYA